MMISIVVRIPILVLFISLGACGVRGPLFIPNPPPVPPAPTQAEPKGNLYPPKDVPAKTTGFVAPTAPMILPALGPMVRDELVFITP